MRGSYDPLPPLLDLRRRGVVLAMGSFAYNDDKKAIATYNEIQNRGCCGSFDREVRIAGRLATIGCNYGH